MKDQEILRAVQIGDFSLVTWDCGELYRSGPQWKVGYRLTDKEGKVIFEGEDFGCSPLHPIDSDECMLGILGFLTLRPGDTDKEWFENYTEEQMEFALNHAEFVAWEAECRWGEYSGEENEE